MFHITLNAFKINHIKLSLIWIDFNYHTPECLKGHVLLLSVFFRECIQRDGGDCPHFNGAKITVILITPDAQNITFFEMCF